MKEKCKLILLVIILLLIILIKLSLIVPSVLEIHNISKLSSDDNNNNLKVQNSLKTSALSNNCYCMNTTTTTTRKAINYNNTNNKNNCLLKNSIKLCSHSLNDNLLIINTHLNLNINSKTNFNSKSNNYHPNPNPKKVFENIPICYLVVTFMITITLVKFVVVVLAYQQLLQNGYIIIQNLYDKHLRNLNFDLLICSQQRPYQQLLKSGHGPDVEENHQNSSEKRQFLSLLNHFVEIMKTIKSRSIKYQRQKLQTTSKSDRELLTGQKYTSVIEKADNSMLKVEASSNYQLLYHQNSFFENHHDFYQQPSSSGYHRFHSKYHEFLFMRNLFDDGKLFYQILGQATKKLKQPINPNIFFSKSAKKRLLSSHYNIFLRQNALALAHPVASSILVSASSTSNSNSIYSSVTKLKNKSKSKIIGFVFMQKILRSCVDRIEIQPNYYHSTIIPPSLTSLSSTICCWKTSTTGNRKRRKRKFSFIWDNKNEYIRNCGKSFTLFTNNNCCYCYCYCCCCSCCCCYCYCCCCCCLKNQLCNVIYENTAEAEVFLVKCCKTCNYCSCYCCCYCRNNCINYHYHCHCIYQINNNYSNECSIRNNSSCVQLNIFKTNNHNKTTTIRLSKNIFNLAKETSNHQDRGKWCLQTSSHPHHGTENDINGGNLLRTVNSVKDITSSVVHNRQNNNKRKLKKNLVWLFIGLVWLEGPKLINCSINHNNNDVTSLNGSETTNKIDSSNGGGAGGQNQNRNGDNSGNGNNSGSRNNSSRNNNEGGTSNTNGPGTNAAETNGNGNGKEQKDESSSSFKIPESESSNGGGGGGSGGGGVHNNENLNKKQQFLPPAPSQKMISSIERPMIHTEKQFQYKAFGHQEPSSSSSYNNNIESRNKLSPKRSNRETSPPLLYVSEEANHAQSDLSRLESIKRQILTKLGLTEKPNVTHPLPKQFIWDTIYRADGIRSVNDFDFNDNNHRLQEHMRLKTTDVLEPPPLLSRQNLMSIASLSQKNQLTNRKSIESNMKESRTPRSYDRHLNDEIKTVKDIGSIGSRWKLFNLTSEQAEKIHQKFLRKYRQQQRLRNNKNIISWNKNRFSDPDYLEGDEFFGSTQEIITFAEKGKVYKKHRLVEFSPPSNKIPKQKLLIRNAEIHIRIEEVTPIPEKTLISQFKRRNKLHSKLNSSREPSLKIWIFQLVGSDFSRKGFDQVARLCTSLSVDHNVLGWQKLDITETVQFWYSKQQNEKLRLLIDCTGCGSRYILHLFDRKFHNSLFMPTTPLTTATKPTKVRQPFNDTVEQQSYTIFNNYSSFNTERGHHSANNNSNKNNESLRNLYHNKQYSHHRYRRKNRTIQMQKFKFNSDSANSTDKAWNKLQLNQIQGQTKVVSHPQSKWLKSKTYRTNREITNPYTTSQDQNQGHGKDQEHLEEGISYEVAAAEFHLEDRLNPNRPFLVLHTEPSRARRVRRRAVDCSGAMHGQCCKESFYVSFKALGWDDWIIAPRGYFANYCRGDCTGPFRTPDTFQTFHAHFIEEYRKMGLLNGMQPCCAPVKFSSMSLIYYGDDGIIKRDLPKMVVDECGCP